MYLATLTFPSVSHDSVITMANYFESVIEVPVHGVVATWTTDRPNVEPVGANRNQVFHFWEITIDEDYLSAVADFFNRTEDEAAEYWNVRIHSC